MRTKRVGDGFEELVDVGVVEEDPLKLDVLASGSAPEVVDPAGLLTLLVLCRLRVLAFDLLARLPDLIGQPDIAGRHGRQPIERPTIR